MIFNFVSSNLPTCKIYSAYNGEYIYKLLHYFWNSQLFNSKKEIKNMMTSVMFKFNKVFKCMVCKNNASLCAGQNTDVTKNVL